MTYGIKNAYFKWIKAAHSQLQDAGSSVLVISNLRSWYLRHIAELSSQSLISCVIIRFFTSLLALIYGLYFYYFCLTDSNRIQGASEAGPQSLPYKSAAETSQNYTNTVHSFFLSQNQWKFPWREETEFWLLSCAEPVSDPPLGHKEPFTCQAV